MFLFYFIAFFEILAIRAGMQRMPYQVLKNIVLTVIDLAVIFRVFFALLSRDCWQIRFNVPLICLWILGFFIFPALSSEGRFSFFHS